MKILLILTYLLFMKSSFGNEAHADKEDVTYYGSVLSLTNGNKLYLGDKVPAGNSFYSKGMKYPFFFEMYNLDGLSGSNDKLIALEKNYEMNAKIGANAINALWVHLVLSALNILPPELNGFKWGAEKSLIYSFSVLSFTYFIGYRSKNILEEYVETYNSQPKLSLSYSWRF